MYSAPQGMPLLQMSKEHDDCKLSYVDALKAAQRRSDAVKFGAERAKGAHWSSFYHYDQHDDAYHHHKSQTDGMYMHAKRKEEHSRFDTYDGLALSDAFLGNYYSQVSINFTQLKNLNINAALSSKES